MTTRVLLVDDDPKILSLLRRGLAYEGFEVYTAMDGESGLAAAQQYQSHLALLDIAMPGTDGFEVCRRLRLHGEIAIIMLTARDDIEDKVNALEVHIGHLRQKLEAYGGARLTQTIRGIGYALRGEARP